MYTHLGKSLAIAVSGLSLLVSGGYLHAADAAKAEPAKTEQAATPSGSTAEASGQAKEQKANTGTENKQARAEIKWPEPQQGYYPPQRQPTRSAQAPAQQPRNNYRSVPRAPYGAPPASAQARQPQQMQPAPGSYGPPAGYYPYSGYGQSPGYYPGYGGYYQPYPYRRRSSNNNFMPWSGDWSSDDWIPFSGGSGRKMPWQGWDKDSQPWNQDDEWDKMPWNWNLDNAPWNNWSGDGRMKDGDKYYKGRKKKKANVTWD